MATDEHCGRESRKKIPINVPLHGSVRRPKVVGGGCDFHAFHDWPRASITRLMSSLSFHDLVAKVSPCPGWVTFDRICGLCLRFDVRFAPKATDAGPGQERCVWPDACDSNSQTGASSHAQ